MSFKTIYLTGAPASGKSTTAKKLADAIQPLEVWEYGARLTDYLRQRNSDVKDQVELRARSAERVFPEDIVAVDNLLISFVESNRANRHIIVDSHPVTKEEYGFRITAFSLERIRELNPDEIWVLYTSPEVAIERISKDAQGRMNISTEEARMHAALQSSVAANYGVILGCPVHLFDTDRPQEEIVARLRRRLQ